VTDNETSHVVLVHGLWLNGTEASVMRRRLTDRYRFDTRQLHYRTVRATLEQNAKHLREFAEHELRPRPGSQCHFVGHSLGGLVILKMLSEWDAAPPGRVVMLGTPLAGGVAAERIAMLPGDESLLGQSLVEEVLAQDASRWAPCFDVREVGMIAGTLGVGLGRVVTDLPEPNDGTVAVEETRSPLLTDHLKLAATHTTLVTSREVTDQVAAFLNHGRFNRERKKLRQMS